MTPGIDYRKLTRSPSGGRRGALAVTALVMAILAASGVSRESVAADLGRLFFDPQQRAELDRARRQPPRQVAPPRPVVQAPVAAPEPAKDVTLNGYVTRSSGRSTLWVNDQAVNARSDLPTSAPLPVPIGDSGKRVQLKVGQSYGEDSGTRDPIAGGKIQVNTPAR